MQEVLCDFVIQCLSKSISSKLYPNGCQSSGAGTVDTEHDAPITLIESSKQDHFESAV